uniref:Acid phosphatase-like protein n=1 Tax=Colletotrichum fructicola (strain Nara gc5) TaxID=1213859 RepID=L2FXZ8_COLFN
MKGLSGMLADVYTTWLSPLTHCCTPLSTCPDEKPRQNTFDISEKLPSTVTRDQPVPMPPPFAGTMQKPAGPRSQPVKSKGVKRGFASLRERFSVRKRFRSDSSSPRRLQISGPTDFRHLHSESFQFAQYTTLQTVGHTMPPRPKRISRTRPASFRPLELSIYVPKRELSPILPHFEMLTPPPPARVQPNPDDDVFGPSHEPSYSSIVERMKERIAGAMLEVDKLQREIDLVMERQSIYVSSRPSTAHSMALTTHDMDPIPTVPALPPAAPSFAERLNPGVDRPHTAPPRPHIPHRGMAFADASAAFITPLPSRGREARPPPPPLPLVLRPPLRKKKSFSRVSSWLFPGGAAEQHHRSISHDSITNLPRPVKGREGFYQCVHAPRDGRTSFDTASTVSTWESEDGGQTVPTTWSPGSTPATRAEEHPPLERVTTFGKEKDTIAPRWGSVGVAF